MGLWIKNADGTIERAAGGGGGGGTFDGDHVLTGDPLNPPAELDAGQLLWDGVEGGGSGENVPHDHDYLPLAGGTVTGDLQVDGSVVTGGTVVQGCFFACESYSAEYIEFENQVAFGQMSLWGNTISTTGSALLHYRANQGYVVLGGSRMRTLDGTILDTATTDVVGNVTVAPTGTTYSGLTVVPWSGGSTYRIYIENNTNAARSWFGLWTGNAAITGHSPGASRSAMEEALALELKGA